MKEVKEELISYATAVLVKEKEFDIECLHFYVKPKSKMFGFDEKDTAYPIKNTPKKLYTIGKHDTLNEKNVYYAPTQSQVQQGLREVGIHITIYFNQNNTYNASVYDDCENTILDGQDGVYGEFFDSYESCLEACLVEGLKFI